MSSEDIEHQADTAGCGERPRLTGMTYQSIGNMAADIDALRTPSRLHFALFNSVNTDMPGTESRET